MMRHIKKFAALLLAAICTMMVLTGCVDKASLYDDTQQIAAGKTAYSATGYQGGYVMGDGSFDFTIGFLEPRKVMHVNGAKAITADSDDVIFHSCIGFVFFSMQIYAKLFTL